MIFIFFLSFGRNLDWSPQAVSSAQSQKSASDSNTRTSELVSGLDEIKARGDFIGEAGKNYRLSFEAEAMPGDDQELSGDIHLALNAESPFGDDLTLSTPFNILADGWRYHKQIEFTASSYFNNLVFVREGADDTSKVIFSNPELTQINCTDCTRSQLIDGSDVSPVIYGSNLPTTQTVFKFTRKGQIFGQVFQAQTENIFQVRLGLKKIGSGGLGQYHIELRGDDQSNGGDIISSPVLAETYFSTLNFDSMKIQDDDYILPLAAKIVKGKYYYLSISNDQAEFNLINTLEILGSPVIGQDSHALNFGNLSKVGEMDCAIYGYESKVNNGRKMLLNESLTNTVPDQQIYEYHFSNTPADYLDIFETNSNNGRVYYDTVSGGISSSNELGNFYTYKFDLPRSPAQINISLETEVTLLNVKSFWSTDNKNWQEINNLDYRQPNNFSQTISGMDSQTLYLKIVTDEQNGSGSFNIGNIKNLNVIAQF